MKVYVGSPAAARAYLEAAHGRADDYYLGEGTGFARRYAAGGGRLAELSPLTGDGYEAWVAGQDPDTGRPRGRLRTDGRAVRFVEVVVNGPKSWSLAAALHPDVAAAYDAAQDRAALQIIDWLAQHAATRVGPRGGQVQLPVELLEAVTVAHRTSRAGDPHRHLHLQVNARVFAAGGWRGLHTVGIRDFLGAINGIGHAAVACDPQFRAALGAHGYTLDATGEILELAAYVGPFSARSAQIGRNLDRYERGWMAAYPGDRQHRASTEPGAVQGIDVLSAAAPGLRGALLAARAAGHTHVQVDGTLIGTDRCSVPGPTLRRGRRGARGGLGGSGKHTCHGGHGQVGARPGGRARWAAPGRPGRG